MFKRRMNKRIFFLLLAMLLCHGKAQNMTQRFPLGCRSRYASPYTYTNPVASEKAICFKFNKTLCNETKCQYVQRTLRKVMISSLQIQDCGSIQIKQSVDTTKSPFDVQLKNALGKKRQGVNNVWFHHTWQGTQTSLEILSGSAFVAVNDTSLDGYEMCIKGPMWRRCFVDANNTMRIATFDAVDHSCDNSVALLVRL